ncbi:winged helix-turn-helix domain-containing protein [Streptomyces sp. NPDC059680]|uniref:winged helix-turn-helix domain-containing protein n=1 Tax=Streptomyces sp. NPDC059680 TaxID=3346904 RepID=UPI0036840A52
MSNEIPRSVQRWRRAWGGPRALRSAGPAGHPRLSDGQFVVLEGELAKDPVAHGWPDQRWTLARVKTVIGRRFHKRYTLQGVRKLLIRHGFSCHVPARRAVERDEEAICGWVKETWPQAEALRRRSGHGSSSSCAVRRCVSCGGERPPPLTCRSREVELRAA